MGSLTKITTNSIKDGEVKTADINDSAVTTAKLATDAVTTAKITDGTITGSDLNSTLDLSSKTLTLADSSFNLQHFNVALLGFKMAVNDSLTVFNLVDGVVDEFHDESGTDEGEGSNDLYCSSNDNYSNQLAVCTSAGFSTTARTESDTSTTASTPQYGLGEGGTFTVPTGLSSANIQVWGAGGGGSGPSPGEGGGGGYAEGTLAVTASQVLHVFAGEGARAGNIDCGPTDNAFLNGGGTGISGNPSNPGGGGGGGLAGVFSVDLVPLSAPQYSAPTAIVVAGSGGGGAGNDGRESNHPAEGWDGGAGGGLTGCAGGLTTEQVFGVGTVASGQIVGSDSQLGAGGGDQEQGGQGASYGYPGSLFKGGLGLRSSGDSPHALGGGGAGYYGGGGGVGDGDGGGTAGSGGGGSSYFGHPQVTSGSTEEGAEKAGGGTTQPGYVSGTNEGGCGPSTTAGEDGYVLITGSGNVTQSTTIVSNAFTAGSAPSKSRIVVFQEDITSTTLNTDIVASVSRNGGSNFSTVTLVDEGYVTGASGQRVLAGLVDISGQPSGTSMRWKLALANNQSKIHGVSLSWA
jgi:hypothetical protein